MVNSQMQKKDLIRRGIKDDASNDDRLMANTLLEMAQDINRGRAIVLM